MGNGSWDTIYMEQGSVQVDVLDSVIDAANLFLKQGYKYILDLGCGTGRHSYFLADNGFKVHACDISETGLKITKTLLDDAGLKNVEYSIQNMYELQFSPNSFDGVLCIWVQGHGVREEIIKGINEIYRVLKPGGTVVTDFVTIADETYGVGEEIAPHTFVGGRPGEENIPHYYTTKEELTTMFKEFCETNIKEKIYTFRDDTGKEYKIDAVIVEARK